LKEYIDEEDQSDEVFDPKGLTAKVDYPTLLKNWKSAVLLKDLMQVLDKRLKWGKEPEKPPEEKKQKGAA